MAGQVFIGGGEYDEWACFQHPSLETPPVLNASTLSQRYKLPSELESLIQRYPLFIVLLYCSHDKAFREYLRLNLPYLDALSGLSCLIWLPEPVAQFGPELRKRWTERLGTLPQWFEKTIDSHRPDYDYERISLDIAECFGIPPEKLPAFVVASPLQKQVFADRVEGNYDDVFKDIIGSARAAKDVPAKERTKRFKKEWEIRRDTKLKAFKAGLRRIDELLGFVKTTEKNVIEIIIPMAPLLQSIVSCFKPARG